MKQLVCILFLILAVPLRADVLREAEALLPTLTGAERLALEWDMHAVRHGRAVDRAGYFDAATRGALIAAGLGLPAYGGMPYVAGLTVALGLAIKAPQTLLVLAAVGAAGGMIHHFFKRRNDLAAAERALAERVARTPDRPAPERRRDRTVVARVADDADDPMGDLRRRP